MSSPTKFLRAEGVGSRSRLSEEERSTFYELMKHTVVELSCYEASSSAHFVGTGFIINSKCDILTNADNVTNMDSVKVRLFDEQQLRAVSVYVDPKMNVALLKLAEPINRDLKYAHIIDGDKDDGVVYAGMEVYCIGHRRELYSFLIGEVAAPDILLKDQPKLVKAFINSKKFSAEERSQIKGWHVMKLNNIHGSVGIGGAPIFNSSGSVIGMWAFRFEGTNYAYNHSEFVAFTRA